MHEIAQRAVANLTLCPTIVKRSTPNCLKSRAHFETDCAASVWTCVGVALVNTDRYRGHTRRRESTGLYARALSASACSLCRPCQRSATHYRPAAIGADGICVDSVRTNTHAVCLLQPTSLFACMIVTRQVSSLHALITARPATSQCRIVCSAQHSACNVWSIFRRRRKASPHYLQHTVGTFDDPLGRGLQQRQSDLARRFQVLERL